MTPELDQHIREKYTKIFSQSCEMSIGDGWYDIIDMLCANIQNHIDYAAQQREWATKWNKEVNDPDYDWSDKPSFFKREEREVPELVEQVVTTHIKEKFGALRFYYNGGDQYIHGLVAMAESMTVRICEDCGSPGIARSTEKQRWVRVLCDKHAFEQGYIEDES